MLRRVLTFFVVLGLALSFWTVPAAAQREIHHFFFKGLSAFAAFSSADETGCIVTDVFVSATDGKVRADGQLETNSDAFVEIQQFDSCNGVQLLAAGGSNTLSLEEFVIDQELNQATLNTTIVVEDFFSGASIPVNVSITWSGTGEPFNEKSVFYSQSPGFKIISVFTGTIRDAQASGTVTFLSLNFTPEPSVFAQMTDARSGEVVVINDF